MKADPLRQSLLLIIDSLFLFLVAALFLTLGAEIKSHVFIRILYGAAVFSLYLVLIRPNLRTLWRIPVLIFGCFLLYEMVRLGWAVLQNDPAVGRHLKGLVIWLFYFSGFSVSLLLFQRRSSVFRLLLVMMLTGFFLAINAIPVLISENAVSYKLSTGEACFFHPLFYFHDWIPRYLLGVYAHSNYAGDLIALGFFPAVGLGIYHVMGWQDHHHSAEIVDTETRKKLLASGLLFFTLAFVMVAGIFLFFGRGTMICFLLSLLLYFFGILIRFRRAGMWVAILLFLIFGGGFLYWAGNFQHGWTELQTLNREFEDNAYSSSATNREAAARAMKIYRDYPWGAGYKGYRTFSKSYASAGGEAGQYKLADFQAMSHYFRLLAEEGRGAWIYFAFLIFYGLSALFGLFRVQSRFQFLACYSLFAAILMVMMHAAFNYLMDNFTVALLVYILMGSSLGILSKEFTHR